MTELEKLFRAAGIDEDDWDAVSKYVRCLAHIFNLSVVALLKSLTKEAYTSEAVAAAADPSELDLKDPFVRLRKFIVAVSEADFILLNFLNKSNLLLGPLFWTTA